MQVSAKHDRLRNEMLQFVFTLSAPWYDESNSLDISSSNCKTRNGHDKEQYDLFASRRKESISRYSYGPPPRVIHRRVPK